MPHYNNPHRSAAPPELPAAQQYYPGVNPYGVSYSEIAESSSVVPYNAQSGSLLGGATEAAESAAKGGLSIPNLGNIMGFIDRMGGIDGIMSTLGKVQKVVSSFQQIAPMAKLLMGSFLPGSKGAAGVTTSQPSRLDDYRPRRRRGSYGGGKRRSGKSGSKKGGYRRSSRGRSSKRRR
ncbi:hypothetical protein [Paenibacillus caui]|uniref:hypothetical protein n=1 Tax=Paenibacillus caui TaxID=2873927 RepID=UPI001CA7BD7B|nr:hypothetical protein [Paenibacillus caui]